MDQPTRGRQTQIAFVLERFGDPDEIEQSTRGGVTWRYSYSEIHWPEGDLDRPSLSADGAVEPAEPSRWESVRERRERFGHFFDRWVYDPGPQQRPHAVVGFPRGFTRSS
ncbi:MAG: hypothetical protein GY910_20345 [bacterium]|nr:hypothetical protein [Deltaproteobacteria bacterium]MCP4907335.1 hypothetical protein [bacterium]